MSDMQVGSAVFGPTESEPRATGLRRGSARAVLDTSVKKFCAACRAEGKKSRVFEGAAFRTAMGVARYYDEDGDYVVEDPNKTTISYSCSRGHRWTETF